MTDSRTYYLSSTDGQPFTNFTAAFSSSTSLPSSIASLTYDASSVTVTLTYNAGTPVSSYSFSIDYEYDDVDNFHHTLTTSNIIVVFTSSDSSEV